MFADEEYTEKVDMKNEIKVAKGEWLHLQMKLMNKIDDGKSTALPHSFLL